MNLVSVFLIFEMLLVFTKPNDKKCPKCKTSGFNQKCKKCGFTIIPVVVPDESTSSDSSDENGGGNGGGDNITDESTSSDSSDENGGGNGGGDNITDESTSSDNGGGNGGGGNGGGGNGGGDSLNGNNFSTGVNILQQPEHTLSFNYIKNGKMLSKYRRCMNKNLENWTCNQPCMIFHNKNSNCKFISKDKFISAVLRSFGFLKNTICTDGIKKTQRYIENVYFIALKSNCTIDHLINFLIIDLYCDFIFLNSPLKSIINENQVILKNKGRICFGYYNNKAVSDKFRFFSKFHQDSYRFGILLFLDILKQFRIIDDPNIPTLKYLTAILNGNFNPKSHNEAKFFRIMKIYFALSKEMIDAIN